MLLPVLLAIALKLPIGPDTGVAAAKGASLLRGCQAELRLMAPDALAVAAEGDLVNGAYCIGYVNGFIANLSGVHASICTKDQPMAALVQVYVRYMEQNPKFLAEDKRIGLRLALQNAFPCPAAADAQNGRVPLHRERL